MADALRAGVIKCLSDLKQESLRFGGIINDA